MVPAWAKRLAVPDAETPARSKMAVDRLIARRDVHLREKKLWRMLYETAGRAEEILGVNIEDLGFAGRRCPVKAKGARSKARRRGQAREDYALETVYWGAGAARLLPRLLKGRIRGPVFVTHRRTRAGHRLGPARVPPFRPDPPPRAGCLPTDADGEVPGTRSRRTSAATASRPLRRPRS
jgi:integrase